ncbi:MAG: OmpH family outer membrane protein [Desulfovibrio sp.]|nr:OmpH family outer membrane protein [Desulfovibrio sp.]
MRGIFAFILAFFLVSGGLSLADDAPAPARIGVVDMQTIAMECDAAQAFKEQMESKYGKERSSLEKQGQDIKKQAEALKNPKTSEAKKVAFLQSRQKLEQTTRNFMRKVEQEEIKFRQDMVAMVFNAAYEVARAKGYNFVVDVTGGGVLYADPSMDLTKDVLAEVNKIYKDSLAKKPAAKPEADSKAKK